MTGKAPTAAASLGRSFFTMALVILAAASAVGTACSNWDDSLCRAHVPAQFELAEAVAVHRSWGVCLVAAYHVRVAIPGLPGTAPVADGWSADASLDDLLPALAGREGGGTFETWRRTPYPFPEGPGSNHWLAAWQQVGGQLPALEAAVDAALKAPGSYYALRAPTHPGRHAGLLYIPAKRLVVYIHYLHI